MAIQSMTRSNTRDVQATASECMGAFDAGARLMRMAVPDNESLQALDRVHRRIRESGYEQPLAADIHFRPELAIGAAKIVEKVRINPGNFFSLPRHKRSLAAGGTASGYLEALREAMAPLVGACLRHGTALRVGVNAGSLPPHIGQAAGHGPEGMVEAALEYLQVFESLGFHQLVLSLKSARVGDNVRASRWLFSGLKGTKRPYPLHIGMTEAGSAMAGRVKSAMALLPLLLQGIGSTLRVSLTEGASEEIAFGESLIRHASQYATPSSQPKGPPLDREGVLRIISEATSVDDLVVDAVCQYVLATDEVFRPCNALHPCKEVVVEGPPPLKSAALELAAHIMQAGGIRPCKTEFISCPACARVAVDMAELLMQVKEHLSGYPGLRIAVMGCMVNGPGEMADADYGFIVAGKGKLNLYRGRRLLRKNLPADEAISTLQAILA